MADGDDSNVMNFRDHRRIKLGTLDMDLELANAYNELAERVDALEHVQTDGDFESHRLDMRGGWLTASSQGEDMRLCFVSATGPAVCVLLNDYHVACLYVKRDHSCLVVPCGGALC